jgi:hypothetical protein
MIYDLKGCGLCRERNCLWAVPLLILQKNSPALPKPCVPRGVLCRQSWGFCFIRTIFVERLALQAKT